jgi:hypothetical protein
LTGSPYCFFHDPAKDEQRREARRAGARSRNKKADPEAVEDLPLATVTDVVSLLGKTINDVRAGRMEARVGNAAAVLVGQLLAAMRGSDLESRIRALEQELRGYRERDPGEPGAEGGGAGGPTEGDGDCPPAGPAEGGPRGGADGGGRDPGPVAGGVAPLFA